MSGHSKWSTIKRQKGANDAKRGQAFTKLSMAITLAVKEGGGIADPASNFKLRLAIDAAKTANMPKDTIDRAVARASGKDASEMSEVVYEGFGPGGFSVIAEAITDNKQRTTPEIKSTFDKNGGTLGVVGSVSYQFEKKGQIVVKKGSMSFDEIFLVGVEAGADDVEDSVEGDEIVIYTSSDMVGSVRDALTNQGLDIVSAELIMKPIVNKVIEGDTEAEKAVSFLEKLEEHPDVQRVFANIEIKEK